MGTKLIIYVLVFDIFLALMVGAYSQISPPSIPQTPEYAEAVSIASSIVWTVGWPPIQLWPSFTLIPSFNFFGYQVPGVTIPGVTIPGVTLFSISFSWLAPVIYVFQWIIWVFEVVADVVGYLLSIFTGSVVLLAQVPVIGPFLTAFVLIVNFVLVWELVKLIRGYGP